MAQADDPNDNPFKQLFELAGDAIFVHREGVMVMVNQRACTSLGYTRDELLGLTLADIETTFHEGRVAEGWRRMREDPDRIMVVTGRQRRKDGSTFPVSVRSRSLVFGGEPAILAIVRDVSEELALKDAVADRGRQLARALARMQAIVDNLSDGLLAASPAGRVELANPALRAMYGLRADIEGALVYDALPELAALLDCSRSSTGVQRREVPLPEGHIGMAVASSIAPAQGVSTGTVVLVRDVTLEKEVERMKTEFTEMVTHELRTPMTSVLGFAKLTRNKVRQIVPHVPDDDRRAKRAAGQVLSNIDVIVAESERLTNLINDVLDIAKMEAGRATWEMAPCDTARLVERALAAMRPHFQGGETRLLSDVPEGLPRLTGDVDRLLQVVINLVSNARKFTETGSVTVAARALDGGVEISVTDTGCGIDPRHVETVFEKFKQVGRRSAGGTGLGLSICREIVTAHGGRIWVDSTVGEGSRFAFWLPVLAPGSG